MNRPIVTPYDILTSSDRYPERMLWDECDQSVRESSQVLARKISAIVSDLLQRLISSGFRTTESNQDAGGAKKSNHMTGHASDLINFGHYLKQDYLKNGESSLLVKHDLYLEDPDYTPTWTHLQDIPPRSGRRVFIP